MENSTQFAEVGLMPGKFNRMVNLTRLATVSVATAHWLALHVAKIKREPLVVNERDKIRRIFYNALIAAWALIGTVFAYSYSTGQSLPNNLIAVAIVIIPGGALVVRLVRKPFSKWLLLGACLSSSLFGGLSFLLTDDSTRIIHPNFTFPVILLSMIGLMLIWALGTSSFVLKKETS
jgi:hypothetical protein